MGGQSAPSVHPHNIHHTHSNSKKNLVWVDRVLTLSTHIIYTTLNQIVKKIFARNCWQCQKAAYGTQGCCMNTQCLRYAWARRHCMRGTTGQKRVHSREGEWQQAEKVMIHMCCCLSCLALLNNSYKTLSFRKVIAPGSF